MITGHGYADKKGLSHVVIYGEGEKEKGVYVVKDMKSGEQVENNSIDNLH